MARRSAAALVDQAERDAAILGKIAPSEAPDAGGRQKITLPDLPDVDEYWIKNKSTMTLILTSGHNDYPDLLIGPLGEMILPSPAFWIMHSVLRGRLEDKKGADGRVVEVSTLEVYRRTGKTPPASPVPVALAAPEGQEATVELICTGSMEDPDLDLRGFIGMIPMVGDQPKRLDTAYLDKTWKRILTHALWVLQDKRRRGLEVDQRRIDLIEQRVAWCDEKLREAR